MLGRRRRRRPSIDPTLVQFTVFADNIPIGNEHFPLSVTAYSGEMSYQYRVLDSLDRFENERVH